MLKGSTRKAKRREQIVTVVRLNKLDPLVLAAKKRRVLEGLSLRKLAKVIGVSQSTLSRVERGRQSPDEITRGKLESYVKKGTGAYVRPGTGASLKLIMSVGARLDRLEAKVFGDDEAF